MNIRKLFKKVKWFFQRGIRGYSDRDLRGFNYYLADIISNGVRDLKKIQIIIPDEFCKYKRDIGFCKAEKDWYEVLDKIADTFEIAKKILHYHYVYYDEEWDEERYKSDIKYFKMINEENKDMGVDIEFHVMDKKETKKFKEGLELFIKHFFYLAN